MLKFLLHAFKMIPKRIFARLQIVAISQTNFTFEQILIFSKPTLLEPNREICQPGEFLIKQSRKCVLGNETPKSFALWVANSVTQWGQIESFFINFQMRFDKWWVSCHCHRITKELMIEKLNFSVCNVRIVRVLIFFDGVWWRNQFFCELWKRKQIC